MSHSLIEQRAYALATATFVAFRGEYQHKWYDGYLKLLESVMEYKEPVHCTPWEPLEDHGWPYILEQIETLACNLMHLQEKTITAVKEGLLTTEDIAA